MSSDYNQQHHQKRSSKAIPHHTQEPSRPFSTPLSLKNRPLNLDLKLNLSKVRENTLKVEDIYSILYQNSERGPGLLPECGIDKFNDNSEAPQAKFLSTDVIHIPNKPSQANYSIVQVSQGLTSIPQRAVDMRGLLTILELSKNKFDHFPIEITTIVMLRSLKLDHNMIRTIPSEISKLTKLEALSLSHNLVHMLPKSFNKLTNLKTLNLEINAIESFGNELTDLTCLESLNIYHNRIIHFPTTFRNLTALTELKFEWFRYITPAVAVHLSGKECDHVLSKLRNRCAELHNKRIKVFNFGDFLKLISTGNTSYKTVDNRGRTLLHNACLHEDISVMRFMITHTPEFLDLADKDKLTPLCLSIVKSFVHAKVWR